LLATEEELVAHDRMLTTIDKSSGGKTIFKQLALPAMTPAPAAAQPMAATA